MPIQKIGAEWPSSVTTRTTWSIGPVAPDGGEHAERNAEAGADDDAAVASSTVAGKTRMMSSITGGR